MKELSISLNNAFGIGKLDHSFDMSKDNVIMIYAPNGTMKTSLARTFLSIEDNYRIEDVIINSRGTSYSITIDGNDIQSKQVYVYKSKDNLITQGGVANLTDDNIIPLITSPEKYNKFLGLLEPSEKLLNTINEEFESFLRNQKIKFSDATQKVYKKEGVLDIQESICALYEDSLKNKIELPDFICYDDLFDIHGTSIKYIDNNIDILLGDNEQKRKQVNVVNKTRWNRICEIVDRSQYIRSNIRNIESLRKDFLCHFVKKEGSLFAVYVNLYKSKRDELIEIINEINNESPLWEEVISTFNIRFDVPYKIKIINKSEVALKHDSFIQLGYEYDDDIDKGKYYDEGQFLNFISSGERRAYYLLLNLFGIEKRKANHEESLLVFDDVVESFDYKNKYAFVEYLADLKREKNFIILILTHNFDFFRTVHSRLQVFNVYVAERNSDREVCLHNALYLSDIIKNRLIKGVQYPKCLISLIPFARNIVEYTKGSKSEEYKTLTSFLHIKENTGELTLGGLYSTISSCIYIQNVLSDYNDYYGEQNYLEALKEEADKACSSIDIISLEEKLILSLASRLFSEMYMIEKLKDKGIDHSTNKNQTFELFDNYRMNYPDNSKTIEMLNKVIMMTSENIHLNNFMFEPIIDISSMHLKKLYIDIQHMINSEQQSDL